MIRQFILSIVFVFMVVVSAFSQAGYFYPNAGTMNPYIPSPEKFLGDFENQLSPQHFFRIHHSLLIKMNRIKEF